MKSVLNLKIGKDAVAYAIAIYTCFSILNVLQATLTGLPAFFGIVVTIIRIVMYLSLVAGLMYAMVNMRVIIPIYVFVLAITILVSYLSFSYIPDRFNDYLSFFALTCIPLSILAYYVDGEQLISLLEKVGLISSFLYGVILIGLLTGLFSLATYETSIGYSALLAEVCLLYKIREKQGIGKMIYFAAVCIYLVLVILYGSRGPVLVFVAFTLYDFVYRQKQIGAKKKIIVAFFVAIAIVFIIEYSGSLIYILNTELVNGGINSRTLNLLTTNLAHDSGRGEIYSVIINQISEHPFLIRGIASDTVIIADHQYTHNIFLELLYEFGIAVGGIMCIYILRKALTSISFKRFSVDPLESILCIVAIVQLLFSSTLWMNVVFWLWIVRSFVKHSYEKGYERIYNAA